MALYSQCFAISAFFGPIYGGWILEKQGNGMTIWISMCLSCLVMMLITNKQSLNH